MIEEIDTKGSQEDIEWPRIWRPTMACYNTMLAIRRVETVSTCPGLMCGAHDF